MNYRIKIFRDNIKIIDEVLMYTNEINLFEIIYDCINKNQSFAFSDNSKKDTGFFIPANTLQKCDLITIKKHDLL